MDYPGRQLFRKVRISGSLGFDREITMAMSVEKAENPANWGVELNKILQRKLLELNKTNTAFGKLEFDGVAFSWLEDAPKSYTQLSLF